MTMKSRFLYFVVFTLSSLNALGLHEALDYAIANDPEVIEKEKRYKEIYYDVNMAISRYLPKIDVTATLPLEDTKDLNPNKNIYDIELSLNQNLFNGFGDINKYKLELSKYKSALYTTNELKNVLSLKVIQSYISLLREKSILDIQESSVNNHENILNKITIKYDAGLGTKLELRLSKTSLYLSRINYLEQNNTLVQAKIALKKHLDKNIEPEQLAFPDLEVKIPYSFEVALDIAMKKNPSVLIARLNKQMIDHELEYTKKDLYPSIDLSGNYYSGENGIYKNYMNSYYDLNIKLKYNFYNGGKDINAKRKIEQKVFQKIALVEKTKQDVKNKLKSKYENYLMIKNKQVLLDNYVKSKELTLDSYYAELSIGKAQLRDILDTTESLYAAKKMQLNGQFDFLLSKYSILEAIGVLPDITYINNSHIEYKKNNTTYKEPTDIIYTIEDVNITENEIDHCYIIDASILHVREYNSITAKIVDRYPRDKYICTKQEKDNWAQTDDGWVSKKYLKIYNRELK